MKKFLPPSSFLLLLCLICLWVPGKTFGQTRVLNAMDTVSLNKQLNLIQEGTKIYENYRAIREDVFQKLKNNALDSLSGAKNQILSLRLGQKNLQQQIDSLSAELSTTQKNLESATRTKNSLVFLGIPLTKTLYNLIMWGIIAVLLLLLVIMILAYKRDRVVTVKLKRDLAEIKEEFDNYRTSSRERMEKMVVSHHREVQKLKGNR